MLGIGALAPATGQQVLDIGCGTGLNFPLLQQRVGASGTIVGIDRSAEMLHHARRRGGGGGGGEGGLLPGEMGGVGLRGSYFRTS
ncbi:class I SAM-dependent methyltransferase, partial [Arthrobacter sp. MP_2.3]|uniref:class I SAM-dependent methyltransferase n=1 Tax=Arthrobacter sp. MP_2.3 TaxID=3349633 RepID=UPI0038D3DE16